MESIKLKLVTDKHYMFHIINFGTTKKNEI